MPQYAAVSLLGVLLALLERLAAAICSPFRSRTRQRRPRSAAQSSAWQRFRECSRAPRPVLFHAVISNLGELLWSCLGTPAVTVLKESLAYCLSSFAGSHKTINGDPLPRSFINALDPDFGISPAFQAGKFPFEGRDAELATAHLLSLAAKLAYEDEELVHNLILHGWGLPWCSAQELGSSSLSSLAARWFAFGNKRATVVSFAANWGPLSMASWNSSVPMRYTDRPGFGGVHDRIFNALFAQPADASLSVFDQALQAIQSRVLDQQQQLFITGHGIGGCVAEVFAQALRVKRPEMAAQVVGVFSFGAPCAGDSAFAQQLCSTFGAAAQRFVLRGDVVPLLPCAPEAVHHPGERILLSSGEWKARGKAAGLGQGPFLEVMLPSVWWRKIAAEGHLAHIFWAALPGLANHLPGEYVRALRAQLDGGILQPWRQDFIPPLKLCPAEEPKVGRIAAWKPIALNKDALSAHDRCFQEEWGTPRASMLTEDDDSDFATPRGSDNGLQDVVSGVKSGQPELPVSSPFDRLRNLQRGDSASEYPFSSPVRGGMSGVNGGLLLGGDLAAPTCFGASSVVPSSGASSIVPEEEFSDISLEEEGPRRRRRLVAAVRGPKANNTNQNMPPSGNSPARRPAGQDTPASPLKQAMDTEGASDWHDCEPFPTLRSHSAQSLELGVPDN